MCMVAVYATLRRGAHNAREAARPICIQAAVLIRSVLCTALGGHIDAPTHRPDSTSGARTSPPFDGAQPGCYNVAHSGCNSGVECLLPKQNVVGSNPITRSSL